MSNGQLTISLRRHAVFWGLAALAFLGFIWIFNDILMPFVLGTAIAYLLNPQVRYLTNKGLPRCLAVSLILFIFALAICAVFVFALPPLYRQAAELASQMPTYGTMLIDLAAPYLEKVEAYTNGDTQTWLKDNIGNFLGTGADLFTRVIDGGQAFLGTLSLLVLTPLVAFFMMLEWERISTWIDSLIPKHSYNDVRELLKQIDQKLSGFVRGQLTVAFVLAIGYAIALSIAGLNYGFLIGAVAGLLSIIPMFGSIVGFIVGVTVAWFQAGELSYVGIIAAIFITGQVIEGNIISPKLLGDSVGLHPLWILFALLAGGSLFGILGMFLAVPVAATIGVLAAFGIAQYKASPFYGAKNTETATKPKKRKTDSSKK